MAPDELELTPGSIFENRFELLEQIGAGSFGRVYRGRQISTGQPVAIKVLNMRGESVAAQRQAERFEREMRICAELAHPNIVRLIDSGRSSSDLLYAVFEHVTGETLAATLTSEGSLPMREAIHLLSQVLDALAAAHAKGIVHRDLKPANIMLCGSGARRNAQVLDFGLGGLAEGARRDDWRILTASREFLGTPFYAAPEQLAGESTSPRSDLYSWGLVFLECVCGQHPFEASGALPWCADAAVSVPDWLARHPLGQLLSRITARDPSERDVGVDELLDALELAAREGVAPLERVRALPDAGERRPLAVVSCRIAIESGSGLDLEERDSLLRAQHDICAEVAARFGGRVTSKLGDRVILGFGYPRAHEDDTSRAARAALELARTVRRRAAAGGARPGFSLAAHIGVHSGLIVVRGSRSDAMADIVGSTAETAAELDARAGAGEVWISAPVERQLRGEIAVESVATARGSPEADALYRLVPGALQPPAGVRETPLVGRALELERLEELWRLSSHGDAAAATLRGDAGIGKSRLLRELRRRADGARWLECRCLPENRGAPLRPLVDLLSTSFGGAEALTRYDLADEQNLALLRHLEAPDQAPKLPLSRELQKERTANLLVSLFLEAAEREPTIFVVEDLHWADPSTLDVLGRLVQELAARRALGEGRGLRFLVLFTSRPEFAAPWAEGEVHVIALGRLSRDDVGRMVESELGALAALPDGLLDRVVSRADGVPLFVEEVTRVLSERGALLAGRSSYASELVPLEIPGTLRALLTARLDGLSASAHELAQIASALGREFDIELLRSVSLRSGIALRRDLEELSRSGLVFPHRMGGREGFVFKHGLVCDAAYESMLRSARRVWHARIADSLARDFSALAEQRADLLAHHQAAAGRSADATVSWKKAGDRAVGRAAFAEAIRHYTNGLELVAGMPASRERAHCELELTESLGSALLSTRGYAVPEVESTFGRARALCGELEEGIPLRVLWGTWAVEIVRSDRQNTAELVSHFARHAAKSHDPVWLVAAHSAAGARAYFSGDFQLALSENEHALEWYDSDAFQAFVREYGYDVGMYAFALRMVSLSVLGYPTRALRALEEMLEIAGRGGNPYSQAIAQSYAINLLLERGAHQDSLALTDRQIALAFEQRFFGLLGPALCTRGTLLARLGKPEEGLALVQQGLSQCQAVGLRTSYPYLLGLAAEVQQRNGDIAGALARVDEALVLQETILDCSNQPDLLRQRSELLRERGDLAGAEESARCALELAERWQARSYALRAAMTLASLLEARGEADAARSTLQAAIAAYPDPEALRELASAFAHS